MPVKANITRLDKGELVLSHAIFRQPVEIAFPKPSYLQEGTAHATWECPGPFGDLINLAA
ncbi:MAG: hypothetical protein RMH97_04560 [Verrucomicrobiales bacterium]|nr:hypothetical protein [Verrucomicrobiales bacterium]